MTKKRNRGRERERELLGGTGLPGPGRAYPLAFRLRVVEEALRGQTSHAQLSRVFGPSVTTIENWLELYEEGGVEALTPVPPQPPARTRSFAQEVKREAVVSARQEHPEWGTRRISDMLARFDSLGVGEHQVRSILHDAGLIAEPRASSGPREHAPRRFERARPNQMWQSDIFTFLLRRHERLYLLLHGPPRHPKYYAQLERQNREHRAWLEAHGVIEASALAALAEELRAALNGVWPRRTLGWKTPSEVWNARQPVDVDRDELRHEVRERAARLRREQSLRDDQAERFAIEAALTRRGLLKRTAGGWR